VAACGQPLAHRNRRGADAAAVQIGEIHAKQEFRRCRRSAATLVRSRESSRYGKTGGTDHGSCCRSAAGRHPSQRGCSAGVEQFFNAAGIEPGYIPATVTPRGLSTGGRPCRQFPDDLGFGGAGSTTKKCSPEHLRRPGQIPPVARFPWNEETNLRPQFTATMRALPAGLLQVGST
jgi:hypothetical protein